MSPKIAACLSLVFATLAATNAAFAQLTPQSRAQAVELFDAATALAGQGRYAEACPKFSDSYRVDPQLGALLHLADCLEKNGQLASAYAAFRDASELAAKKSDPRKELADDRIKALEPSLSRLTVDVSAAARLPGLRVGRDGLGMDAATWGVAIAVDPGEHRIAATAPGYAPWETTLTIAADGSTQSIEVPALEPLPAGQNPPPVPDPTPKAHSPAASPGGTQRVLGYVAGGVGVVGIGIGVGFALDRKHKIDEANGICPPPSNQCPAGTAPEQQAHLNELNRDARTAGIISTVAFVAGGAALVGGVTLVLTAPRGVREQGALRVVPWFSPGGGGLVATRSF